MEARNDAVHISTSQSGCFEVPQIRRVFAQSGTIAPFFVASCVDCTYTSCNVASGTTIPSEQERIRVIAALEFNQDCHWGADSAATRMVVETSVPRPGGSTISPLRFQPFSVYSFQSATQWYRSGALGEDLCRDFKTAVHQIAAAKRCWKH